jgi:hypothetical protein
MDKIIKGVREIVEYFANKQISISEEHAFSYFIVKTFYENGSDFDEIYFKVKSCLTDGSEDGGIDFVYFDENESKVILGQSKYVQEMSLEEAKTEFVKMFKTMNDYRSRTVGRYKKEMIDQLTASLDNLDEDNKDNIEYVIFTKASNVTDDAFKDKYQNDPGLPPEGLYRVVNAHEIEDYLDSLGTQVNLVQYHSIEIDKKQNALIYENNQMKGMIVNISSESIFDLYRKYHHKGLFDLNIRTYIRNNEVDRKINHTLDAERQNFWFLNNGLTIACRDFEEDGNKIKLYDFSIVNGGQTTSLIGNYKGKNTEKFWVLCKILSLKNDAQSDEFYTKIAEASNSQKAIMIKDLRSNSQEMKRLKYVLSTKNVNLEIKRGAPKDVRKLNIKNDEYGQLILSFVYQQPGIARTNKAFIFNKSEIYEKIFRIKHEHSTEDEIAEFARDVIRLRVYHRKLVKKLNESNTLTISESEILNNGELTFMALYGVIYALVNELISVEDFIKDHKRIQEIDKYKFNAFISTYKNDDFELKLETIIMRLVSRISNIYAEAYDKKMATNISNFLKTDSNYIMHVTNSIVEVYKYDKSLVPFFNIFLQGTFKADDNKS